MSPRPTIALLPTHWESSTETGWLTRQVAGALASGGDVHVITPGGDTASISVDGVFPLHRLGTPLTATAERRRDLLIEAAVRAGSGTGTVVPPALALLLDEGVVEPWQAATDALAALRPDRVVIVGHDNLGALAAVDAFDRSVPVSVLALGTDEQSVAFSHFARLFDRADSVLAVTEAERSLIVDHHGRPEVVHGIGAPMAANPSALSEPNTWVGTDGYVLVLTGVDEEADDEQTELARLLRIRFPERTVGIAHNDAFAVWHQGQTTRGWPIERTSDLDRLMAWATVTVDLDPGEFFARRCITSLLYGTPILVPAASRAHEHTARGRGGLWFEGPAELAWCVEAMLDPSARAAFSAQGRTYAEDGYGSTDRFIDRVLGACGLATMGQAAGVAT